jgi:hypothetical protein
MSSPGSHPVGPADACQWSSNALCGRTQCCHTLVCHWWLCANIVSEDDPSGSVLPRTLALHICDA